MFDASSLIGPEADRPDRKAIEAELRETLRILVAGCTERQRTVIVARYWLGKPSLTIATEMRITEAAVSRLHRRAIERMMLALAARGITRVSDFI